MDDQQDISFRLGYVEEPDSAEDFQNFIEASVEADCVYLHINHQMWGDKPKGAGIYLNAGEWAALRRAVDGMFEYVESEEGECPES